MAVEVRTGHVGGVAPATSSCRKADVRSHAFAVAHNGRRVTTLGGQQDLALAEALDQLPSGTYLVIRDKSGREWRIEPGRQATVTELRRAA